MEACDIATSALGLMSTSWTMPARIKKKNLTRPLLISWMMQPTSTCKTCVKNILHHFSKATHVSRSGYSKLQPHHGVEHIMEIGDTPTLSATTIPS